MADPSEEPAVLKMQEPLLPFRRIHEPALMRSVDHAAALIHDRPDLVGSFDIPAPERDLPALPHTAGRRKDIIKTVPLIHLRPFDRDRRVCGVVAVKDKFVL